MILNNQVFIKILESGFDMVIGNRFKGHIEKNAMPASHYYIGNPILSTLGNIFFIEMLVIFTVV